MTWVMSSKKEEGAVHFYIGAVKVAEICFDKRATKWRYFIRFMRNEVSYEIPKQRFYNFKSALEFLHTQLSSPPPSDHSVPDWYTEQRGLNG